MSYCEDSNINKSYIVQTVDSSDIFSACTEIYVTNITPCTGDTININSNLNVTGNISGTTFYGDGSQLSGIITTDNYVTGGVYTASTKSLYFTGTTGFTPFSIDVSALLDDTNNYVTGGTYNPSTDIISLFRNDNVTIDITGVTDTFTTGGTYDNGTSLITFVKNDNTSYTIDLSTIDVNDTFVTGSTLNGDALTIRRNDGVDIVVTGFSQTFTGNTNTTCIGDIYVSNIHSCSPLRINSNDEGNVYFGSTSGVTIDVINSKLGIGTSNPIYNLDVVSSGGTGSFEDIARFRTIDSTDYLALTNAISTDGTFNPVLRAFNNTNVSTNFYLQSVIDPSVDTGVNPLIMLQGRVSTDPGNVSWSGVTTRPILRVRNNSTNLLDVTADGKVGIGTTSPSESLDVDGNTTISGTLNIGKLGTNPSINNLGIDSIGNVVVGTTGDTDTNTFVTGGTLSSNDLILEKNNGVDVNPINLSGLVSGKTDLTLFNSHTGDTNNPHQTSFSGLTSTAHTHTLSEITDFNTYSGNVQTQLDGKTDNTDFISHTGDTSIHFTKGDISLSEIGNSAHTHTLSEITDFNTYSGNVQTQLDGKVETILFNSHTGDTNNPHDTSFSNLISTAHTHTISDVINLQNELDGKLNVSEFNTYSGDVQTQIDNKLETSIFNSYTGSVVDVFVSSGNANSVTQQLSFTNTTGGTFNVTNSAALFSDNDVNVTGGTYNPSNGCVTFTTNSGTTFDVCGFVTGITDTFVTGGTLSGTDLILERSNGIDVSGIDLSSLISGKLDITTFNTYTGDTQTILNSKTDNTDFTSHTGDTTIHYTKGSINLSDLGSSAHTHTLSEITDFNTYSGNVQTQLDTKIQNGVNSGGANEVFSGNSGTDLYFRTISGGSNTTITTIDDIIKVDVSVPVDTNTFVTGFTYDDINTFTISRNNGLGDLTSTISVLSGITYYGDGSNLSGISSSDFYVTGGTFSSETLTLDRNDGGSVVVTGFTSQPSLNDGEIFVGDTGNTAQSVAMTGDVNIDNTGVTTIQPDSVTYDKIQDVSQAALLGSSNVSGGTVTEIPTIDLYLTTGSITTLLENTSNWDINGNYTGSTITGTYQGQNHYDGNYFFTAVDDNVWIRLIRG